MRFTRYLPDTTCEIDINPDYVCWIQPCFSELTGEPISQRTVLFMEYGDTIDVQEDMDVVKSRLLR